MIRNHDNRDDNNNNNNNNKRTAIVVGLFVLPMSAKTQIARTSRMTIQNSVPRLSRTAWTMSFSGLMYATSLSSRRTRSSFAVLVILSLSRIASPRQISSVAVRTMNASRQCAYSWKYRFPPSATILT